MQKYAFLPNLQNLFGHVTKSVYFCIVIAERMAMMVEELNCLTNHHLEEIRVLPIVLGFLCFLGTSVRYDRWFVVNQ